MLLITKWGVWCAFDNAPKKHRKKKREKKERKKERNTEKRFQYELGHGSFTIPCSYHEDNSDLLLNIIGIDKVKSYALFGSYSQSIGVSMVFKSQKKKKKRNGGVREKEVKMKI